MNTLIKSISLKGTAELDVSKFKDGLASVGSLRRKFEKEPLKIPVELDLRDIRSQAAKAAQEIKKAVGAALGTVGPVAGSSVSKGGIFLPPGATAELEKFRAAAGREFKRIETDLNNGKGKIIQSFEQLGQGLERVTTTTLGKKGKSVSVKTIDTRPVNDLKRALDQLDRDFSSRIGAAKGGRGDLAAVLDEQRAGVQRALRDFGALAGNPELRKAEKMLDSLDRRISESRTRQSEKQTKDFRSVSASLDKQRNQEIEKERKQKEKEVKDFRSVSASLDKQRGQEIEKERKQKEKELKDFRSVSASLDKQRDREISKQERDSRAQRIRGLRSALAGIDKAEAGRLGAVRAGKGDVVSVLDRKRTEISKALSAYGDLADSPAYLSAQKKITRLDEQIGANRVSQRNRRESNERKDRLVELAKTLDSVDRAMASRIGTARGSGGDLVAALQSKKLGIQTALGQFADLADSRAYRAARKAITTIDTQIANTSAKIRQKEQRDFRSVSASLDKQRDREIKRQSAAENRGETRSAQRAITREDRALQTLLKRNKADEAAARAIRDQVTRETELNRVLNERERLLSNQSARYRQLSASQRGKGREDAANKFEDAGMRVNNDLNQARLDRFRDRQNTAAKASDMALERGISRKMADYRLERERLNAEERLAKKIKDRSRREAELNDILHRRQSLQLVTARELSVSQGMASSRGLSTVAGKAETARDQVARDYVKDQNRFATATRNSGHALDFHTSSLLKNAATFTKWYIPAQSAMAVMSAFTRGIGDAVAAQRTFKVLEAVFQGTEQDAKRLANQTLILASANGRGADEAAEAAVKWARLGLTRTQVLLALETSLRAANVAEITTAEATEYLTATYKSFGLTISDLPATLDYLNALSNRYNVTNKDLFEGISRTASVAKQAGLEFEDLAGIITVVTAATGRPGQEIGNALKFILNRARTPEVMRNLQKEFDIDITDPTGDVKRFSDVLSDLAAIYPTLTRLEKARLNDIVSGARQGNRFAIVMENWTDSLIAQAKAGLDANSAMRENQKVLSSLDAQVQAVSTSWTAMLYTMGEAGVFDTVAQGLHSIAEAFRDVADSRPDDGDTFALNDRKLRAATATLLGDRRLFTVSKGRRTEEEIEQSIEILRSIRDAGPGGGKIYDRGGNYRGSVFDDGRRFTSPGGDGIRLEAGESWDDVIRQFEEMLAGLTGKRAQEIAEASAKDILDSQKRVTSLGAAQDAFQSLARDSTAVGKDPGKLLRQFDDAVSLLDALPGGARNVAQARLDVRPLLESGRSEEAADALNDIAGSFKQQRDREFSQVEERRQQSIQATGRAVTATRDRIVELNQELARTPEGSAQTRLQSEIATTTDLLKDQEEQLRTLTRKFEKPVTDPLNGLRDARLTDYFRGLKEASEVMGGVLEGFGNTGFANLDAKLKLGAAQLQGDLVQDALVISQDENAGRMAALRQAIAGAQSDPRFASEESLANLDALREELALHEAIEAKLGSELDSIREASAEIERKLELERQAASLRESYDDGAASAAARAQAFAIGRTEGERIVNQTMGVFGALGGEGVAGSIRDPRLGAGDPNQDARELGTITNNMAMAKQGLLTMEDRLNRALAERVNLEGDITEEQRKQAQEATKRLMLASREDQLRAAGAAAALRARGATQFGAAEFQFFSQETRGAISNLMPSAVAGMDDSARDQSESRRKLDEEISLLASSLAKMRQDFENLRPQAEKVAGGLLNPPEAVTGANSGQRVIDLNQQEVKVSLNTGGISVALDFSPHVAAIQRFMQQHFDTRFQQLAADMKAQFGVMRDSAPSTGAANATF